jgi:hypothetical protein
MKMEVESALRRTETQTESKEVCRWRTRRSNPKGRQCLASSRRKRQSSEQDARLRSSRKGFPGRTIVGFELAEVLGNEIAGLVMVTRTSGKISAQLPGDFRKRLFSSQGADLVERWKCHRSRSYNTSNPSRRFTRSRKNVLIVCRIPRGADPIRSQNTG